VLDVDRLERGDREVVVTPFGCQPFAGSMALTQGGATSIWLSEAPGGSRNCAE
jgi:hypothetical protein